MICARCLRRASRSLASTNTARRLTTTPSRLDKVAATSATTQSTTQRSPPAATSTSAAQPFSSADTLSPQTAGTPATPSSQQKISRPPSSVAAGTPLKGLNYFKNKEDPIAMEDHEYPDWLWELLDEKKKTVAGEEGKDPRLYAKSARSRQAANKRARKAAMERPEGMEKKVPIYEQTIDLPAQSDARQELTKAMREKRRKDIKTANFLKSMA